MLQRTVHNIESSMASDAGDPPPVLPPVLRTHCAEAHGKWSGGACGDGARSRSTPGSRRDLPVQNAFRARPEEAVHPVT